MISPPLPAMRVLMISAAYSPASGGVATHLRHLVNGLVQVSPDISVDVLTLRKPGSGYKRDPKGRVVEWKLSRGSVPEFSGRRVVFERFLEFACEHWHELRPDLLHAHDFDSAQIGWMLRIAFNIPLVMTVHRAPTKWRDQRFRENAKDCFMEAARVHRFVDRVIVPSQASKDVIEAQGFRNVSVIPHGVSKHLLSFGSDPTVLTRLNVGTTTKLIFCPVRADEHKDPAILVRAAASFTKTDILFVVTSEPENSGDDLPDARALKAQAKEYGLEEGRDIMFVPPFPYGAPLATIYRRADAVVVPSLHESFGQTVIDAFMFNKPVIARDSMALGEIVTHGSSGFLFETAPDLVGHLRRVLSDDSIREALINGGSKQYKQRHTPRRMAMDYLRVYEKLPRYPKSKK